MSLAAPVGDTHRIVVLSEPGLHESAVLADLVTIRVNGTGAASAIVELPEAAYETAILDLSHYASEFGPFRRLDDETPLRRPE